MRKLYLVRHGQTLFNLRGKTQGWCDSPLTEEGKSQALQVRKYFEDNNIKFDEVYSSTQERACDTAELITDQPYKRLKGLKEWNFGMMEGEPEDLQHVMRGADQLTHEDFFVPWGGEHADEALERFSTTIDQIVENSQAENILCVVHGGVMWVYLVSKLEDPSLEYSKYLGNCVIIEFNILEDNTIDLSRIINVIKGVKKEF